MSEQELHGTVPEHLDLAGRAARIALEAGALTRGYFERGVVTEYKGDVDLVTEADRASEKLITERLSVAFPDHGIYGEEGVRQRIDSEYRWYVDPLDGTTNFAHGFPWFCVSIALAEGPLGNEELLAGVIYQPVTDELFTAARGEGAYLNNKRIHVSEVERLATSLLGTGFPAHKRAQNPNIHFYWNFTLRSHGVRRAGSAALDLAAVACGRFDGFWEFGLHPWDTAAGVLLVREAGGTVTDFAGNPYKLGARECLASNTRIHGEMRAIAAEVARTPPSAPFIEPTR